VHDGRRTRPVLIVLLIAAIALITLDFRDAGSSPAHTIGADVFGPVERTASAVASPFESLFRTASGHDSSEITSLQKQNDQLRAQLAQAQVSAQEQAQLGQLLHLTSANHYRVVAATVIAAGGAYSDTVTIDVGTRAGITANETVLNGDGLVGTVTAATASSATVQLATDAAATIGVRMDGTNEIGAVTGTGSTLGTAQQLKLTLFSATAVLQPGQTIVTFGSVGGRPYVAGVPVGQVTQVTSQPGALTQTALVKPFADFTGLGVLGVVVSR
jgi:rod shape-determining protein MreC